jgi:hypothetical protein
MRLLSPERLLKCLLSLSRTDRPTTYRLAADSQIFLECGDSSPLSGDGGRLVVIGTKGQHHQPRSESCRRRAGSDDG